MAKEMKEVDVFRDTYVRYLGYANEVGEAFRSIVAKNLVRFSYAVAIGYVIADSSHKAVVVYKKCTSSSTVSKAVDFIGYLSSWLDKMSPGINVSFFVIGVARPVTDTQNSGKRFTIFQQESSSSKVKRVALSASDTLMWQGFASVIIPGLTINRICYAVQLMQKKFGNKPFSKSPWISVAFGLISIPFIIRPIDDLVENGMNLTYREWVGYNPSKTPD